MMLVLEFLESVLTYTVKKGVVRKLADTVRRTFWKLSLFQGSVRPHPPIWNKQELSTLSETNGAKKINFIKIDKNDFF